MQLINLSGKKIVVAVTGSIAIYKACELVRLFVKSEATVQVVMSPSATKFISPLTFEALTRQKVLTDSSEDWSSSLNHIDIVRGIDAFVVAPATANTINKLAKGIADNILLQSALANSAPVVVAPSANTKMLQNHYTQGSLKMLNVNDVVIVASQSKELACGDFGDGALAEPKEIYIQSARAILKEEFWENRKVVVTGGGTREAIDEVRFISNHSSGKMANALSLALYLKGADVCLVTTKLNRNEIPQNIHTIEVESALDMLEYTSECLRIAKKGKISKASMNNPKAVEIIKKRPFLFMASAVGDYRPKFQQDGKLKKSQLGSEWSLELTQNPDILKTIDKNEICVVGFKAEMDEKNGFENAKRLIEEKGVNGVCYNLLSGKESFGTTTHEVTFITKDSSKPLPKSDKLSLAFEIIKEAKGLDCG